VPTLVVLAPNVVLGATLIRAILNTSVDTWVAMPSSSDLKELQTAVDAMVVS
jgi:hypothetical protein